MAYDLEEQERIAELKAWWKKYGSLITWLVIAALAIYSAWTGWNIYQRKQAAQASVLYYEMQTAVMAGDVTRIQRIAKDTQSNFGGTAYASMNSLVAAKVAYEQKDMTTAKAMLKWVMDNAADDGYKAIARIRLAGLLLDEQQYDAAVQLLSGEFPEAFASIAEDRKGDILLAQNKRDEAKAAYMKAFEKAGPDDPGRQTVQLKLEEIGASPQADAKSKAKQGDK